MSWRGEAPAKESEDHLTQNPRTYTVEREKQ